MGQQGADYEREARLCDGVQKFCGEGRLTNQIGEGVGGLLTGSGRGIEAGDAGSFSVQWQLGVQESKPCRNGVSPPLSMGKQLGVF